MHAWEDLPNDWSYIRSSVLVTLLFDYWCTCTLHSFASNGDHLAGIGKPFAIHVWKSLIFYYERLFKEVRFPHGGKEVPIIMYVWMLKISSLNVLNISSNMVASFFTHKTIFYRQLDFSSSLELLKKFWKTSLKVAQQMLSFIVYFTRFSKNKLFWKKKSNLRLGSC